MSHPVVARTGGSDRSDTPALERLCAAAAVKRQEKLLVITRTAADFVSPEVKGVFFHVAKRRGETSRRFWLCRRYDGVSTPAAIDRVPKRL